VASKCAEEHPNDAQGKKCLAETDEEAQRLGIVDTEFARYRFNPPLAWIALWQHPFSRPARFVI